MAELSCSPATTSLAKLVLRRMSHSSKQTMLTRKARNWVTIRVEVDLSAWTSRNLVITRCITYLRRLTWRQWTKPSVTARKDLSYSTTKCWVRHKLKTGRSWWRRRTSQKTAFASSFGLTWRSQSMTESHELTPILIALRLEEVPLREDLQSQALWAHLSNTRRVPSGRDLRRTRWQRNPTS